jgi:hypothetical protein
MEVNAIDVINSTSVQPFNAVNDDKNAQSNVPAKAADDKTTAAVYEASAKTDKTYKPDMNRVKELMAESERQVDAFKKLVEGLLKKQANAFQLADGWFEGKGDMPLKDIIASLDVDDATRAQAQKDIAEGGYYSVEETAKRILDFAVALSGGDPSKISLLKDAVMKGFKSAEKDWGGELPEISQKTLDTVMKGFDEWEEAKSSSAINLLQPK